MRLWSSKRRAAGMVAPRREEFALHVPTELVSAITAGGTVAPRISRAEALQVPAVMRARNIICSSLATLPIRVHRPDRTVDDGRWLIPDPDPEIPHIVVFAETIEDLLFEGVSWWRVTEKRPDGFPLAARHVPWTSVHVAPMGSLLPADSRISPDMPFPIDGQVFIDGIPVPDDEIIRFDSPNPPLLVHAARAIRTCLLLDTMASSYVREPLPLGYFDQPPDAPQATDDEIKDILDQWEDSKRKRSWVFVPKSLRANIMQWDPQKLQLAEQRQNAVLEIARATGLDPEELGVSTTSRTYANEEQRDQAKLKYSFGAYINTMEQRLSMRDVLPRRWRAQADLSGFLRSDELTRMQSYQIGLAVGAYADENEVREHEYKPALTPAQKTARARTSNNSATPGADEKSLPVTKDRRLRLVENFEAQDSVWVGFAPSPDAQLKVNKQARTITGVLLPWNKVGDNGFAKWRFVKGSVEVPEVVSRVKLNVDHDHTDLIGKATRIQSGNAGLIATWQIAKDTVGDTVLSRAEDGILDGFSAEVQFDPDSWEIDPDNPDVRVVTRARLRGAAITGTPAFDDARLIGVNASRNSKGSNVPDNETAQGLDVNALFDKIVEANKQSTENLVQSFGASITDAVKTALEGVAVPQTDGPQPVSATPRARVIRDAPVYTFNGLGHSIVRDAWYAGREREQDAIERLRKYRSQCDEMAKLAQQYTASAYFTPQSTGTASQIIPPGYRPDLYVPELMRGRPLVGLCSRGTIGNATPFVVPTFGSATGVSADHTEGTNPSDGSLTFGTITVTPTGVSGRLTLTREIVDSSNPAIDQIALAAMRESYNQQTEQKVYAELNGAAVAGNTFEYSVTTPPDGPALISGVRGLLAKYPFVRFAAPTGAAINQKITSAFATAVGSDDRPLLPSVGAQNTAGIGNAVSQGWFVDGLAFVPAWSMGDGATDDVALIVNSADVWVWESPLLTFRFEEKQGPANIEMNIFGYFATNVLRPAGVFAVRNAA